ncbi:thiamine-phosphate kinase [Deefgea tanakiae]|uniref:Thiamine-monophosphate kinase n=1 Tax=Deefgea tanakiae TaxID=2865840 RepID=A0ABX8Z923_9NEIS|nr:thiamine-phosphate kinase [Deefgea tanakiae]QZA79078.1 thiamine-phosphate kinase [Deefgea tanakiae]
MNEFDLIAKYFTRPTPDVDLGVGDDAALISVSAGHQLAISVDMLVAGRHFFADADPERLGHKCLAVNLSDMAAMGAKPTWFTLSLALPEMNEPWLAAFSRGMFALADQFGVPLIGGDTTRGPLSISIQIAGEVPKGAALLRSGALVGDDIWVSGPLGAAAAAVMHRTGRVELPAAIALRCDLRLDLPTPRVALGQALRGLANSAMDISDGLLGDLAHICEQSQVMAIIDFNKVPQAIELNSLNSILVAEASLAGGDDYELCFTASPANRAEIETLGSALSTPLFRVGSIATFDANQPMVQVIDTQGQRMNLAFSGFDHFK